MDTVVELIKNHTSIRRFLDEPVTDKEEQIILDCALRGASAGNMMQYTIIVIRDRATLKKLAVSCDNQSFIADAGLALLVVADNNKWSQFFKSRKVTDHSKPYETPQIPDFMLGVQDAMIAAQNSVIAAESIGLGTCYIGDIMEKAEYHRELFDLPDFTMPVTLIVVGHYDKKPTLRPRFEQKHMVAREVYPTVDKDFVDGMFIDKEDGNPDFAQKFYTRKIEADFFKEMIRSVKLYMSQWL